MDFGRPHDQLESTASRSKIRYLEPVTVVTTTAEGGDSLEEREHNVALDNQVIQAANQTAAEMFLSHHNNNDKVSKDNMAWMIDASYYTERLTPSNERIQEGDLVVIQQSFDKLDFVYCKRGEIYSNRNGHFHHNDFLNQPFGTQLRSRDLKGYGYCYLLKPTPELWTRSLNHRTQVVHELDQSQVIFQLYLKPNDVVVESGTGSGAMSHAILRTIAPAGQLHTYEFNHHRSETARTEFEQHGLGHLVTVYHKDVCRRGIIVQQDDDDDVDVDDCANNEKKKKVETPGFDLPGQSVDAVFLDLPEPWWAVPHAAYVLRPNARIATYSPCVEQTQRTVAALERAGFHSIKTFEYRQKEHYLDEVEYESPPSEKRPKPTRHDVKNYPQPETAADTTSMGEDDTGGGEGDDKEIDKSETQSIDSAMAVGGGAGDDKEIDKSETQSIDSAMAVGGVETDPDTTDDKTQSSTGKKRKKQLVARPFVMMRGHTAFLTFATAGIEKQPNPNEASSEKQQQ